MTLTVSDRFFKNFVNESEIEKQISKGKEALEKIKNKCGKGADFLGWYDLPENYDKIEFSRIKNAAKKIQSDTDILIVIGIGGSYLGARAAIEFIKSPMYNSLSKSTPDIYFAGNNISSSALSELLELCEGKDISLNVISKSGTTTEPAIAFRVFKALLTERYGEEAARERIYVTTDKSRGTLKEFSGLMGYETFIIPDNVGGRYSILTAGGLLPIAVAGIDIDSMMLGARDAMTRFSSTSYEENEALKYAVMRNVLENQGKSLEILAGYEPYMLIFNEWWKQLFGESEGKDKKGIFPASVIFSTDLHSLGQYIQDGQRNLFLTTVNVKNSSHKFTVPNDEKNFDGLNYISGFELDKINKTAMFATLIAHSDGGVPNILIELSDRSEYSFGYLIYFFELACAISGYILGVNPFDQPGVEAYKKNMFALLGKRGYEDIREKIEKRISEQ